LGKSGGSNVVHLISKDIPLYNIITHYILFSSLVQKYHYTIFPITRYCSLPYRFYYVHHFFIQFCARIFPGLYWYPVYSRSFLLFQLIYRPSNSFHSFSSISSSFNSFSSFVSFLCLTFIFLSSNSSMKWLPHSSFLMLFSFHFFFPLFLFIYFHISVSLFTSAPPLLLLSFLFVSPLELLWIFSFLLYIFYKSSLFYLFFSSHPAPLVRVTIRPTKGTLLALTRLKYIHGWKGFTLVKVSSSIVSFKSYSR